MTKPIIQLQELSIGYKLRRRQDKIVAANLCAEVGEGQLACLLGPNGVGKSTLLRTISSFQAPLSGKVFLAGRDVLSLNLRELSETIAVVLTEKPDLQYMRVEELVATGRTPYTDFWGRMREEDLRIVERAMSLVGVESMRHRRISTLSDGERQKAMIAKALAQETPIVMLDEPTAFLDFSSKIEVMQVLKRMAAEEHKTILMSTHDAEYAFQMADVLWVMLPDGLAVGTPRTLADNGVLGRFIVGEKIQFDSDSLSIQIVG